MTALLICCAANIDKASNNFAFTCKKYYKTKPSSEAGLNGDTPNKMYTHTQITKEEIVNTKITYCKTLSIHVNGKDKAPTITHWLPKMYKTPIASIY